MSVWPIGPPAAGERVNNGHFLESPSNKVTVNGWFLSQLSLINSLNSDRGS